MAEADLDFVLEQAAPDFKDRQNLKRLIAEDESFRKALVGDERVFQRVIADREVLLRISPALYFEVLFRKSLRELETATHTVERVGSQTIAVFDTREVVGLLERQPVLEYLSDMLASFTRVESFVVPIRVRRGVWRKIRFSDMDIDSLSRFCESVDEESRFGFYKRIADVCLFILGVLPEYAQPSRDPLSGQLRSRPRRDAADYEEQGRKFYRLAGEHPSARALELSGVLWLLHEQFATARKPLTFIAEHYLRHQKIELFEVDAGQGQEKVL